MHASVGPGRVPGQRLREFPCETKQNASLFRGHSRILPGEGGPHFNFETIHNMCGNEKVCRADPRDDVARKVLKW